MNLSAESVLHPDLPNLVKYALSRAGMAPSRLILEITERAFAAPERAKPVLVALRAMGVDIAADDFGTGYSALEYLRHFPLTMLKLDRLLISGIGKRVEDEAIIRAVIMIATSLGQQVVAEGVETPLQLVWASTGSRSTTPLARRWATICCKSSPCACPDVCATSTRSKEWK